MVTYVSVVVLLCVVLGVLTSDTFGKSLGAVNHFSSNTIPNKQHDRIFRSKREIRPRGHQTIHHYARHGLCRTFKGKQHFYKAMKKNICGMEMSFIATLVMDLCRNRNKMLDMWVAGMFDTDGDGFISHFERHMYIDSYN